MGPVDFWAFDAMYRVAAGHRVALQQMVEQAGQGRELATNAGPGQRFAFEG